MDLDEEDDEEMIVHRHQPIDNANGVIHPIEDVHPIKVNSSSSTSKSKSTNKLSVQDNNHHSNDQQQPGDEWEEFEDLKSNYEQIRLKFQRPKNDGDENNDDDYSDDENTHRNHADENYNHFDEIDGDSTSNKKDKSVWKLDQVKETTNNDLSEEKIDEQPTAPAPAPVKPATTGAYRPPQLRGNSSVTVVSAVGTGSHQRSSKKEKPNLASTEEFPTLGAVVHKK